ncbi:response regulator [Desertivirga arenae]|uniref:response regulator n=1 Tax=Desertivirga arenae TaxID=2810309 RepID=UPI001A95705A|nr:response regulator transcription factor [Pedobacter sp. SYSU D00823]
MDAIKVLLAEDHTIVRNGIRAMLESDEGFQVVGEATDGLETLTLIEKGLYADVVLTDISMPEMDGLELSRELQKNYPELKVVILSMLNTDQYIFEAFDAGVRGYVLKNAGPVEMKLAISEVAKGKEFVCSEIGMDQIRRARRAFAGNTCVNDNLLLTNRDKEILALVAEGLTNNEIADKIFTSRRTVEGHRQSLKEKAGAKNTAQLIAFAIRQGII